MRNTVLIYIYNMCVVIHRLGYLNISLQCLWYLFRILYNILKMVTKKMYGGAKRNSEGAMAPLTPLQIHSTPMIPSLSGTTSL